MCVREVGKLDPYLRKKGWLWCPIPTVWVSWGWYCRFLGLRALAVVVVSLIVRAVASFSAVGYFCWLWNWIGQGESDCLLETKQRDFVFLDSHVVISAQCPDCYDGESCRSTGQRRV